MKGTPQSYFKLGMDKPTVVQYRYSSYAYQNYYCNYRTICFVTHAATAGDKQEERTATNHAHEQSETKLSARLHFVPTGRHIMLRWYE